MKQLIRLFKKFARIKKEAYIAIVIGLLIGSVGASNFLIVSTIIKAVQDNQKQHYNTGYVKGRNDAFIEANFCYNGKKHAYYPCTE